MAVNLLVLVVIAAIVWPAVPTVAASSFTVTPAFAEATIGSSGSADLSVQLENHTATDQSFSLSVADFGSLNESGGVAFLGTPASELEHRYGLASWLQLDRNVVFVPAGGSAVIGVTVQNRASLAPGGHYGAILATAITDTGQAKPLSAQVGLKAVLSSLVLLTKSGGASPSLNLVSEDWPHTPVTLPKEISQRFQNAGNVHVVPRGTVEVRDPAGRLVARGVLNENSDYILPESFRRIPVELASAGVAWLPGRYTITTQYRFDGSAKLQTWRDTVWFVGDIAVVVAWLIVAGAIGWLGWWWWRRGKKV